MTAPEGPAVTTPRLTARATAALIGYLATIPAANLLIAHLDPQPVGFGYAAPAGVYAVGVALVLRDLAREWAGRTWVLVAMGLGVAASYLLADPTVATASVVAFAASEGLDFIVYEPLRARGKALAMAASNVVGLAADSMIFLWLAYGNLAYLPGQIIGKAWMTVAALILLAAWRRAGRPGVLLPTGACTCRRLARQSCGHCAHDRCEDCGQCSGGDCTHNCPALAVTA